MMLCTTEGYRKYKKSLNNSTDNISNTNIPDINK